MRAPIVRNSPYGGRMAEFIEQDLSGSTFERVLLRGARFRQASLDGADLRAVTLHGIRVRGAEIAHARISADLLDVVVNGVDIAPLVDAELNRRHPERALLMQGTVAGYREGFAQTVALWEQTISAARTLPPEWLHRSVDDEWSLIQTLRHVSFAIAAWIERMLLGRDAPWDALDLPWDEAPGWDGIPWDREARPSLDEAVAVFERRQVAVREFLSTATDDNLAGSVTRTSPGWPQLEDFSVKECLHIALTETWEHRQFAERDLAVLLAEAAGEPSA